MSKHDPFADICGHPIDQDPNESTAPDADAEPTRNDVLVLLAEIARLRDAHKLVVDELARITRERDTESELRERIYTYCDNYDGEPNPLGTIMQMIEEHQ